MGKDSLCYIMLYTCVIVVSVFFAIVIYALDANWFWLSVLRTFCPRFKVSRFGSDKYTQTSVYSEVKAVTSTHKQAFTQKLRQ